MTWHLECNNKKLHNKLLAIKENTESAQPIRFRAPETFETHDFSKRDNLSLEELCVQQAKMLRTKYKNINLFYSGGCDSHYILKIFLDSKIKLDKIIMVKSGFKRADFEIDDYAVPFVKKLGIPYEIREPSMEYYKSYYLEAPNATMTQHEYWHHFRLNNHFENLSNTPVDTINLMGKEKSKLCMVNGKWYTYCMDVEVTPQPSQFNFFLEDPRIYAKQCHMLIDQIELHKDQRQYNQITHYDEHQDFWNISMGRYDTQDSFPLKSLEQNGFFNNKDQEAITAAQPNLVIAWKRRNRKLIEQYGDAWFNQGEPAMGTVGVFSDFYCLTENSRKTVDELYPDGFKL